MNETKNVSKRTRNPIFFRKDGGWKSVSTDCIVCMEACAYKCIFYMDDGTKKEVRIIGTGTWFTLSDRCTEVNRCTCPYDPLRCNTRV